MMNLLLSTLPRSRLLAMSMLATATWMAGACTLAPAFAPSAQNPPALAPPTATAAGTNTDDTLPPPVANGEPGASPQRIAPAPEANPFAGADFYIEPSYVAEVEQSAKRQGADAAQVRKVATFPTAIWLSAVRDVDIVARTLDRAAAQERSGGKPVVTVFALYDLPDRDCAATASSGDLSSGDAGERRYRTDFVDRIAVAFRAHEKARIVALVEPDSLANAATNLNLAKCAAAAPVYERSIAYAIKTLAMPNVSLYVDAAHAGWLGWAQNRNRFAKIVADVLADAGGADKIRGFVTNVSNYDTLENGDLAKLEPSDPAHGELQYVQLLDQSLSDAGIAGKAFVIDTGRNGRTGLRTRSGSWCNVRGAGLGERPRANPAPLVDAFLWVKPPGESDGGSDAKRLGYDPKCGGPDAPDSAADAPRAGSWFHDYFIDLVKNAAPPL